MMALIELFTSSILQIGTVVVGFVLVYFMGNVKGKNKARQEAEIERLRTVQRTRNELDAQVRKARDAANASRIERMSADVEKDPYNRDR